MFRRGGTQLESGGEMSHPMGAESMYSRSQGVLRRTGVTEVNTAKAPALQFRRNPLESIGIGLIGVGSRGRRHLTEIISTPGVHVAAVCEIYEPRLGWALATAREAGQDVKGYRDYQELIADKSVDAIIIATPDHWHARMVIDGCAEKKDIYVQKCLTRTLHEAKEIVTAVKESDRVLQLAHTRRSEPIYHRMREIYDTGILGPVSLVNITMFRNTGSGAWDWEIEPEGSPETIDWQQFLGPAPKREFDPDRFFRWRKYWDYGTGISGDLLSHEWDAANFVMKAGIPETCIASGGIYYWKGNREVPDVLNVVYDYPEKGLSITWNCTFANSAYGLNTGTHIYGKNASLKYNYSDKIMEVFLEPYHETDAEHIRAIRSAGRESENDCSEPLYTFVRGDELYVTSHFQNFIDCVRTRQRPRCNEDDAFEEAVTAIMSVISYKEQRLVRWDPIAREIV
jgi:predicted dehydrogenase